MTASQRASLKSYSGSGYMALNHYLRADRTPGVIPRHQIDRKVAEKQTADIDNLFDQATPLAQPATVYRGLSGTVKASQLKPGAEFSDKAYVSTSTDPGQADEFSFSGGKRTSPLVRVHLPAGSRAVSVAKVNGEDVRDQGSEREVLLPRGARFRVLGKGKGPDGSPLVDVELVPA